MFNVKKIIVIVLILLPLIFLISNIYYFKVNVPWDDEWNFISTINKFYTHTLPISDLWIPVNEHRIVLPMMIYLNLIKYTSWDNAYMLIPSVFLATVLFIFVSREIRKLFINLHIKSFWPFVSISIMIFSINQFENWMQSAQLSVFLCVLSLLLGLKMLLRRIINLKIFILACLSGIIATFSFGYGILIWPIGLFFLLIKHQKNNKKKYILIWTFISTIILKLYFTNLKTPPVIYSSMSFYGFIRSFVLYILLFIGRPLGVILYHKPVISVIVGTLGLGFNIYAFFVIFKKKIVCSRLLYIPLLFSLITIGCAVITALSRAGSGYEQAHSSRYISVANFIWISNIILITIVSQKIKKFSMVLSIFQTFFFILIISASIRSVKEMRIFSDMFKEGRDAILRNTPLLDLPKIVHPDHKNYIESVLILKKFKLSLYKK
jgi:hypothetical protein